MKPRGIVVCVNYADLLKLTLHRNMRHLSECLVVTSPDDVETQEICARLPNVRVYATDAFYRYGAKFNKGLAIEEGFDVLGRHGWILSWDADIVFPDSMSLGNPMIGCLYGARRRIVENPMAWRPHRPWARWPVSTEVGFPGYFHLFHADDPVLFNLPWYDLTFTHAGGGDGYFQSRWAEENKIRLNIDVLHLGPRDTNWFGRASKRVDGKDTPMSDQHKQDMETFLRYKGWHRRHTVSEFAEKVDVPGAPETGFVLKGAIERKLEQRNGQRGVQETAD